MVTIDSETQTSDVEAAGDIASNVIAENSTESRSPTDDEVEVMAEKGNKGVNNVSPRLLPQRVKARNNWAKVRMKRASLVKKIRRQVRTL